MKKKSSELSTFKSFKKTSKKEKFYGVFTKIDTAFFILNNLERECPEILCGRSKHKKEETLLFYFLSRKSNLCWAEKQTPTFCPR